MCMYIVHVYCAQIGMTIHARVLTVNVEKFSVDLTSRSSDLKDSEGRFRSDSSHSAAPNVYGLSPNVRYTGYDIYTRHRYMEIHVFSPLAYENKKEKKGNPPNHYLDKQTYIARDTWMPSLEN